MLKQWLQNLHEVHITHSWSEFLLKTIHQQKYCTISDLRFCNNGWTKPWIYHESLRVRLIWVVGDDPLRSRQQRRNTLKLFHVSTDMAFTQPTSFHQPTRRTNTFTTSEYVVNGCVHSHPTTHNTALPVLHQITTNFSTLFQIRIWVSCMSCFICSI